MALLKWSKMLMRWALENERSGGTFALYISASVLVVLLAIAGGLIFVLADFFDLTRGLPALFVFLSLALPGIIFGIPACLSLLLVHASSKPGRGLLWPTLSNPEKLRARIESWCSLSKNGV